MAQGNDVIDLTGAGLVVEDEHVISGVMLAENMLELTLVSGDTVLVNMSSLINDSDFGGKTWITDHEYSVGDMVSNAESIYVAISTTIGDLPGSSPLSWKIVTGTQWGDITGDINDQTDLIAILNAKSNTDHVHDGVYEPANVNIQSHIADIGKHREIDDDSLSVDVLWSAEKINSVLSGAPVNIPTALEVGTRTETTFGITSDGSEDDVVLLESTNLLAGLMTSLQWLKLNSIADSAEVNVQSDWDALSGDEFILNKPNVEYTSAIPDATASQTGLATDIQITKLDKIEDSADANVPTDLTSTPGTTSGPTIRSSTGQDVIVPSASDTESGVVTTGTQYFAGNKLFAGELSASNLSGTNTGDENIIDALDSDSSTDPLSAKQGKVLDDKISAVTENLPTQLSNGTVDDVSVGITSDGATDDVILAASTSLLAGVMSAAKFNEVALNNAKETNEPTELSVGTKTSITLGITSDGATDDVVLPSGNSTEAGLLGADKFNEIVANTAKQTNQVTALSLGTRTVDDMGITSDGATNDVILPGANDLQAGLMTAAEHFKLAEIADQTMVVGNINKPLLHLPLDNSLDFERGVGSVTFSRASIATYIDRYGVLQHADVDEPRFEKEGLLIEGYSTNLYLESQTLDSPTWLKNGTASVVANDIVAPDGTTTADKVTGDMLNYIHQLVTITVNDIHSISMFVKKGTAGDVYIKFAHTGGESSYPAITYTFSTDSFSGSILTLNPTSEILSDGWVKIRITTNQNTDGNTEEQIRLSPSTAGDCYVWGVQSEELPFASSYIPTTDAAVSRNVDSCYVDMEGNVPQTKASTIVIDADTLGYKNLNSIVDVSKSHKVRLGSNALISSISGVVDTNNYIDGIVITDNNRYLTSSDGATLKTYINGILRDEDPIAGELYDNGYGDINIGSNGGSYHLYGHVRNLRLWDESLANEEANLA